MSSASDRLNPIQRRFYSSTCNAHSLNRARTWTLNSSSNQKTEIDSSQISTLPMIHSKLVETKLHQYYAILSNPVSLVTFLNYLLSTLLIKRLRVIAMWLSMPSALILLFTFSQVWSSIQISSRVFNTIMFLKIN